MSYVVGIASIPGGGKTCLTTMLSAALGDAKAIHLDDYQDITSKPITEIKKWHDSGADFNEFEIPLLSEHLYELKHGQSIQNPVTNKTEKSGKYIIFETNYGREHVESGKYIDLLVWIDTPLDLALARSLKKITSIVHQEEQGRSIQHLNWINSYLDNYISNVRELLNMQRKKITHNADLIVDGTLTPPLLTTSTLESIANKLVL